MSYFHANPRPSTIVRSLFPVLRQSALIPKSSLGTTCGTLTAHGWRCPELLPEKSWKRWDTARCKWHRATATCRQGTPLLWFRGSTLPPVNAENDSLRLDVYNGILLSSLWDAAFDGGMITFSCAGVPIVSTALSAYAFRALRLDESPILKGITPTHELMLMRHRAKHQLTG
jgi:hypothetical protein